MYNNIEWKIETNNKYINQINIYCKWKYIAQIDNSIIKP